jgi:hypothetical protein
MRLVVNNMALPVAISERAMNGSVYLDPELAKRAFPLGEVIQPMFYSADHMQRENQSWPDEEYSGYLGTKDGHYSPGDIDPRQSVLIGDLGPDLPIALDFRRSQERPSLV